MSKVKKRKIRVKQIISPLLWRSNIAYEQTTSNAELGERRLLNTAQGCDERRLARSAPFFRSNVVGHPMPENSHLPKSRPR